MVGLDDLVYVGNHGLERWDAAGGRRDAGIEPYRAALRDMLAFLERDLAGVDGIRFEDKGFGLSVHYRASPDPAEARQAILAALDRAPLGDLSVMEGKRLIELRPPLAADKGGAVRALVHEYGLAGVVYLGDDVSDVEALTAVRRLRERGETRSLAIGVRGPETLEDVAAAADVTLEGPEEVETFLARLADELLEEAS
jgi:trehalose 6-phosphate phosphatase